MYMMPRRSKNLIKLQEYNDKRRKLEEGEDSELNEEAEGEDSELKEEEEEEDSESEREIEAEMNKEEELMRVRLLDMELVWKKEAEKESTRIIKGNPLLLCYIYVNIYG